MGEDRSEGEEDVVSEEKRVGGRGEREREK